MGKLSTILDQIDGGTILLPEFQRGYVWNRDQVRGLMRSLYLGYPVGSLLVWETETDPGAVRGPTAVGAGTKLLLLDGQQRITSLYGLVRGKPPVFFEGKAEAFTGLRFNVDTEVFEFYAPAKMRDDPMWVDVTGLFATGGLEAALVPLNADPANASMFVTYVTRLQRLRTLLEREFHQERITGQDKGLDDVVDIFNRVNSGGTKLSKGDLALAKICAAWPEARSNMRTQLAAWDKNGYSFSLDWLLRSVNAVATGRAPFSALETVSATDFQSALKRTNSYVGHVLDTVRGRLGLDHDRVLMGRYAVPVMALHLSTSGGTFADAAERDRWLFWYVHSAIWGRHTGSVETSLASDYDTLIKEGLPGLLTELERSRGGNLALAAHDFTGHTVGSRFYPLLYLMTRVLQAKDLCSGIPLKSEMLGHLGSLQVHHIFPKARLRDAGYESSQINAVANFAFLTQDCNLKIGARSPEDYFAEVASKQPGALKSQWIPTDERLWHIENYAEFLGARRELLAASANDFFASLITAGPRHAVDDLTPITIHEVDTDERSVLIDHLVATLTEWGFTTPERDVEISDPETGEVLAVAEAFWPDGLQTGTGDPVVLELDPEVASLGRLQALGYEVFTMVDALREYAERRNLAAAGVAPDPEDDDRESPEG